MSNDICDRTCHKMLFISNVMCCSIFIHVVYVDRSVIVPNATIVVYGILFGGMHPTKNSFKLHRRIGMTLGLGGHWRIINTKYRKRNEKEKKEKGGCC